MYVHTTLLTVYYIHSQQGLRQSPARSALFTLNLIMFIGQTGNLVATIVSELKILQSLGETLYDPTVALEHWEIAIVIFPRINVTLSPLVRHRHSHSLFVYSIS